MTLEEQLAEANAKLAKQELEITKLTGNISNQNSYITKLEKDLKDAKATTPVVQPQAQPQPQPRPQPRGYQINPQFDAYQRRKWRQDVIEDGLRQLNIPEQHKNIIAPEIQNYCLTNMTDETTTVEYVLTVGKMLYGGAIMDPNHAIYTNGLIPQVPTPTVQPEPATEPPQPAPTADEFRSNFPPGVARQGENIYNPAAPTPEEPKKITSVADAMSIFKERLQE